MPRVFAVSWKRGSYRCPRSLRVPGCLLGSGNMVSLVQRILSPRPWDVYVCFPFITFLCAHAQKNKQPGMAIAQEAGCVFTGLHRLSLTLRKSFLNHGRGSDKEEVHVSRH